MLALLLNKRIRKTKEHALHDSTNTDDSMHTQALATISQFGSPMLKEQLGTSCS